MLKSQILQQQQQYLLAESRTPDQKGQVPIKSGS